MIKDSKSQLVEFGYEIGSPVLVKGTDKPSSLWVKGQHGSQSPLPNVVEVEQEILLLLLLCFFPVGEGSL